ncbi:hypothetical protein [Pseudotabrizicola formosa]|uniref:hypothetical protein n=1 Tax=Pseudotabrizicola formosa TaxID=2030009 RepID=UPI0011AFD26F|nr:hypothetical protein [Pseudotabrizicola formosa]
MAAAGTQVIGCAPSPLDLGPFAQACGLPFVSLLPDPDDLHQALQQPHHGPRLIEYACREG